MFCKNCGAKLEEDAKFCVGCGTSVSRNTEAQSTSETTPVTTPAPTPAPTTSTTPTPTTATVNNAVSTNNKKKGNKTTIIIIVVVAVVCVLGLFMLLGKGISTGGKQNTTGITKYNAKDVSLNCTSTQKMDSGSTANTYMDVVFNYKDDGNNTYQVAEFTKMVVESVNLTDEKFNEFVHSIGSINCVGKNDCQGNHVDAGTSSLGWDTTIDRNGNTITITFYNLRGIGQKVSSSDMKTYMKSKEDEGYTCK